MERRPFFEGLDDSYIAGLRDFTIGYLRNRFSIVPQDAEDIAQDVFLRIARRGSFAEPEQYAHTKRKAYLRQTAYRLMINRFRSNAPVETELLDSMPPPVLPDAEDRLDLEDRLGEVRALLSGMNRKHLRAYLLYTMGERTYEEIAEEMGSPSGTVMSRIRRAREYLERNGYPQGLRKGAFRLPALREAA